MSLMNLLTPFSMLVVKAFASPRSKVFERSHSIIEYLALRTEMTIRSPAAPSLSFQTMHLQVKDRLGARFTPMLHKEDGKMAGNL